MITKFLIIILCIVAGTMIGLIFSKKLSKRADYYDNLCNLINVIMSEVKFRKSTTKNILKDYISARNSALNVNLSEYIACENLSELKLSRTILTALELDDVKKLLLSLGTADSETQIFELENYKLKFTGLQKESEEKKKKFGGMYIKLGFFAGLALGILLI